YPTGFGRYIDGPILKSPFIHGPSLSSVWKGLDSFCVYDNKGNHLSSIDPSNGNMTKPP
ncbi:20417_t:CDS:2, partial [Rhizophagus irregularis]